MRTKFDGQNIMLIVILALILILSYYSIPLKEQVSQAPQTHDTDYAGSDEVQHEEADVKEEHVKEAVSETAEDKHAKEAPVVAVVEKQTEPEKTPVVEKEAVAAGSDSGMPAVIAMDNSIYAKHKKGISQFTHQKHFEDYKIGCGDCHHDDSGEPLTDLKLGDDVVGCAECHSEPGKAPKSKKKKLSDSERLEYHAEALHDNCIACHKTYNKKNKTKAAPASCGKCHPKNK